MINEKPLNMVIFEIMKDFDEIASHNFVISRPHIQRMIEQLNALYQEANKRILYSEMELENQKKRKKDKDMLLLEHQIASLKSSRNNWKNKYNNLLKKTTLP